MCECVSVCVCVCVNNVRQLISNRLEGGPFGPPLKRSAIKDATKNFFLPNAENGKQPQIFQQKTVAQNCRKTCCKNCQKKFFRGFFVFGQRQPPGEGQGRDRRRRRQGHSLRRRRLKDGRGSRAGHLRLYF